RNGDSGGEIYGESYVARLVEAQDALNLLSSDLMDIVRYDGHKTTIFQNVNIDRGASRDGQTPGEIDLSIGKGLVVKGEGKVYKLEQQNDLGAALQEYDRKLDAFYDLAGVPRFSRELVSRMGNLSGKAIERLYQDAVESTREAQGLYGESFRELAQKISAMLGFTPSGVKVIWNRDVISADVESLAREYEIGARSIRSVMRNIGIDDVEAMRKEIEEEKMKDEG
ncbi:MAG: phage portal protein, partial [Candidatus Latescibacterota bacterium]